RVGRRLRDAEQPRRRVREEHQTRTWAGRHRDRARAGLPLPQRGAYVSLRLRLALLSALLVLGGVAAGLVVTYNVLQSGSNLSLDRESAILAEVIHEAVLLRGDTVIRVPAVVETYLADETGVRSAQVYQGVQLLWEDGGQGPPRPLYPVRIA